eukprot:m.175428 g.175428  ORF g.175428 m.175428 type:complete len:1068 (+) comp39129_c0_seq6:107-3310(+)
MSEKESIVLRWLLVFSLLAVSFRPAFCLVDLAHCTFETGTCGWKANGTHKHDWKVAISSTANLLNTDHTFLTTGKGQYMSTVGLTSASLLESVVIYPSDEVCGIRFSYALDANGKLQVEVDPGGSLISLPSTSLVWTTEVVSMQINQPFKIVFLMEFSQQSGGKAALDDVQFLPCKRCTFEKYFCSWSSLVEDTAKQIPWTRSNGVAVSPDLRPSNDHTTFTAKGYYIYIGGASSKGKHGQLISKKIYYDDDICGLRLLYNIYGTGVDSLKVEAIDDDNSTFGSVTIHSGNTSNFWYATDITFHPDTTKRRTESTRFVVTGTLDGNSNSAGTVALDDIEYLPCLNTDNCLFADGSCLWNLSPWRAVSWNFVQNHANAIRGNLVANFSSESIPPNQSTFSLSSLILQQPDGICSLRVTYEMEVTLVSSLLRVDVTRLNGTAQSFNIPAANNSGKLTQREIAITTLPVSVVIWAIRDRVEMGSIILHELQFLPCSYSSFESTGKSLWKSHTVSPVQWNVSEPCLSSKECPTQDHTFGSKQEGHFLLAKSRTVPVNITAAELKWSDLSMPGQCGVRLWYYIAYGSVRISVTEPGITGNMTEATWQTTKTWVFSELAFHQTIQTFKVSYTSLQKSGFSLALDDLQVTPCRHFRICTFERDLCDWTPVTDPYGSVNANWIRWSGLPPGGDGLSTLDHTKNSYTGHYVYMAVDTEADGYKTAILAGVPLGQNSRPCGVEFWYRILRNESESAVAWLTVEQIFDTDSGRAILWNASDPTRGKWERVTVQLLPTMHQTVSIEFRGFTSTTANFNLDDIAYVEKDCAVPTSSPATNSMLLSTATAGTAVLSKETSAATTRFSEKTSISLGTDDASPTSSTPTRSSRTDAAPSKLYSSGFPTKSGTTPQTSVGKSSATIIGGAVGGSMALLILALLLIVFLKRQQKQKTAKTLATNPSTSSVTAIFQNKSYEDSSPAKNGIAIKEPTYAEPNNSNRLPNDDDDMKENPSYRDPHIGRESSFSSGVSDHVYAMPDIKSTNRPPSRVSENILYEEAPDKRSSKRRESENAIYEGKETNQ